MLQSSAVVVEHQHHGHALRCGDEELRHGVEQTEALLVRLELRRLGEIRQAVAQ